MQGGVFFRGSGLNGETMTITTTTMIMKMKGGGAGSYLHNSHLLEAS